MFKVCQLETGLGEPSAEGGARAEVRIRRTRRGIAANRIVLQRDVAPTRSGVQQDRWSRCRAAGELVENETGVAGVERRWKRDRRHGSEVSCDAASVRWNGFDPCRLCLTKHLGFHRFLCACKFSHVISRSRFYTNVVLWRRHTKMFTLTGS